MKNDNNIFKNLGLISQLGIMMAVPIIFCMLFGIFLDNIFGTEVVFLIIFTILGVMSAFRNLYVIATRNYKK